MKTSLLHARHSCAHAGTDEHTHVFTVEPCATTRRKDRETHDDDADGTCRDEPQTFGDRRSASSPFAPVDAALPCGRTPKVRGFIPAHARPEPRHLTEDTTSIR